ncbi:DgyrCDS1331 [Dimorphilus gyrociliatus]|uniref:Small RNA 2'-O-methyltransferase n=1 Tax=Dimorphilus gyrociliatus TaxID=2664684 RepID=A0A7I8VC26_9ANNE|nr:DgyrCDS1331 [Dimorphilus gyrociliatus]
MLSPAKETVFDKSKKVDDETLLEGPKFSPLLFLQRYDYVAKVVLDNKIKSLVDFGCSECRFVSRLCRSYNSSLEEIYGPSSFMYDNRRENPLVAKLLKGSIEDFDKSLQNVEAVAMIEVIEHLYEETLKKFPVVVFGKIRPKFVIITTPNSDFNILFNNLSGFRHHDHKFEWTREEFKNWVSEMCETYGYDAKIDGVGTTNDEDLKKYGYCSQIAVFRRKDSFDLQIKTTFKDIKETTYEEICTTNYPIKAKISQRDKLLLEVSYYCRLLSKDIEDFSAKVEIPLSQLFMFNKIQSLCNTKEDLKRILIDENYTFIEESNSIVFFNDISDDESAEDHGYEEQDEVCSEDNKNSISTLEENWEDDEEEWGATTPEKEFIDERFEDAETSLMQDFIALEVNHSCPWKKKHSGKKFLPDVIKGGKSLHNLLKGNFKLEYNIPRTIEESVIVDGQFDDAD